MIGVIADDFTGAAEIGAVGLRHGLRAEVLLNGDPSGNVDLVCIDTDSRSCAPEEAGRRSAAAANLLASRGADWIYKKVDSVLRGQITAEIQAILSELELSRALLIPANPSLGRTIQKGCYFIRGKPIHETEFARDPEYPRTSARVHDLLGTAETSAVTVCATGDELPNQGIIVGQVENVNDLRHWASRRSQETLVAGGAEFFGALLVGAGHKPRNLQPVATRQALRKRKEVFVCGSTSESSHEFVRSASEGGTPVFSLPQAAQHLEFDWSLLEPIVQAALAALASQARIILNVGLPPINDKVVAKMLATYLAQVAESLVRQGSPGLVGHFFAEGGATAKELVRHLGWKRLAVLEEVALGTATLAVDGHPKLTIKPGSYLWPDSIQRPTNRPKCVGS